MKGRHYDVIVLGRGVGSLVAAALLARRDFSVLVLGQGDRPPTYRLGDHVLYRRAFSLLGAHSPALRRVLVELAQSQTFRRRTVTLDPMLSVVMPGRRFELPPEVRWFEREIEREFGEIKRVSAELYAQLSAVNDEADRAFAEDVVFPPGTFWERRQTHSAVSRIPFLDARPGTDILADFPHYHPYRSVVLASVAFASDAPMGPRPLSAFAMARLHGSWTRGVVSLAGGEDELTQFLIERVQAHGGMVELNERAERVVVERDRFVGVQIGGEIARTGGTFLLHHRSGEELAELSGGEGITARASRAWPRVTPVVGRFIVSMVVRREGVPEALGPEAIFFGQTGGVSLDPLRPLVHLSRPQMTSSGEHVPLVAEVLVPLSGGLPLTEARQAAMRVLVQHMPWLERHLVVVDSPHDGLPVWVYEGGRRREVDRLSLLGGNLRPEPMVAQHHVEPDTFFGLAGEPLRGPIENTYLLGKTVLPALGQEGELLAATSVARLVTRTDPRREKMRLEMWNKVEIG